MRTSSQTRTGTDALSTMIDALGLEVAAIKKSGGSTSIDLFGGTFVTCTNGQYIYRFPLTEEVQLRDDTPTR